jgi:hypothetical protein
MRAARLRQKAAAEISTAVPLRHHKKLLDIASGMEVKFLRAKRELNRWGRVAPALMFVAGMELTEIPPMSRQVGVTVEIPAVPS